MFFAKWRIQSCYAALIVNIARVPGRRVSADYASLALQTFPQCPTLLEELVVTHVLDNLDKAVFLAEIQNFC